MRSRAERSPARVSSRRSAASTSAPAIAEAIRAFVREQAENGADVIKIFGSASIRDGGRPTMTQEQLDAACGEARELGLRSVVHAHGSESARRTVEAGCTAIEHGALLDRGVLQLMAREGVYFDPNTHLIFQNYFDNKARYLGVGNYTEGGIPTDGGSGALGTRGVPDGARDSRSSGWSSAPTRSPAPTGATSRS